MIKHYEGYVIKSPESNTRYRCYKVEDQNELLFHSHSLADVKAFIDMDKPISMPYISIGSSNTAELPEAITLEKRTIRIPKSMQGNILKRKTKSKG